MHRHFLIFALALAAAPGAARADEPNRGGSLDLASVDIKVALERFTTAKGYKINLFASEEQFPEIAKPVAMGWDGKGRLWVATLPTYPQVLPGKEPEDKIVILEDTDGDGRADKLKVFADNIYLPMGFEFGNGGVFVTCQPNLLFLKDTDGDDVADVREIALHGFGTEDSHHAINAFTYDPGGGLYMMEGTFHHSQVETPWGVTRLVDSGVFRFEPRTNKLGVHVSYSFANPWGHIFDYWGQNFIADASGGSNYFAAPMTGHVDYPRKHPGMKEFTNTKVRPTCGCEFVTSAHFPGDIQGNWLLNNCIGFQGIKNYKVTEEDSGFVGTEVEPLLSSSDPNFRPVDIEFGPDGALYIVDWFNPLIGHMQYSIRDPRRDQGHGRIWRITYPERPLLKPAPIAGAPIPALLDQLKDKNDRTRYRVRQELWDRDETEVMSALEGWLGRQESSDPDYEHHALEALWLHQAFDAIKPDLLAKVLHSKEPRARAAATRVLRYWFDRVPEPIALLKALANDEHPRVRLEAVLTASYMQSAEAAEVALEVLKHPMDYYLNYALNETMVSLEKHWKPAIASGKPLAADNPAGLEYLLRNIATADLVKAARNAPVYQALLSRDGVVREYRAEATRELAKLRKSSEAQILLDAIARADRSDVDGTERVLLDLAGMLAGRPAAELAGAREQMVALAEQARRGVAREVGYAGLIMADGGPDKAWELAARDYGSLRDLLEAVPLIPDPKLRDSLYPLIKPLLSGLPEALASRYANAKGTSGRYVRIDLPGRQRILTLAEVEVISGGRNVARDGSAKQQSTAYGGTADKAIDGNKSPQFGAGGQTHSEENIPDPWWEVDLRQSYPIESIAVWNRTEDRFASRLKGFTLTVLDENRRPVFVKKGNAEPTPSAEFSLEPDAQGIVRRAAIAAIAEIPGHEAEVVPILAKFAEANDERAAAVRSLLRLPKARWPKEAAGPLVTSLMDYAQGVRAEDRVLPEVREALQLCTELTGMLPADAAKKVRGAIGELGVTIVLVRTIPHLMAYDRKEFVVPVGKPAEIVFENIDVMPHNLIITAPGAMIEVSEAAERMATQPDAFARQFVPDSKQVLFATKLVQSRETERLAIVAPKEPGDYPFVCTFPGHWRTMNGVMHVVEDVESYLEKNPIAEPMPIAEARPFVRDWRYDDLSGELAQLAKGRNYQRGRDMFTAGSCITCHRVGEMGGVVGPNLGELDPKTKAEDVLMSILEPSREIKDQFRSWVVLTVDGKQHAGVLIAEDDKSLKLMPSTAANASGICEPIVIAKGEIEERNPSPISLMPEKMVNTMTKEEILDLLAYVLSRGNAEVPAFRQP